MNDLIARVKVNNLWLDVKHAGDGMRQLQHRIRLVGPHVKHVVACLRTVHTVGDQRRDIINVAESTGLQAVTICCDIFII